MRRSTWLIAGGTVLGAVVVFVLVWFQPQKLFFDDKVSDALPEGFVPVTAATTNSSPTVPVTTVPRATTPTLTTAAPATTIEPSTTAATPPTVAAAPTVAPSPQSAILPSEFASRSHGTSGRALFLTNGDGTVVLRIEDLDTDNGPDLKLYLSTNPPDGEAQRFDDEFVNLGKLKGNVGDQNYEVPAGTDLTRFNSIVIWCDRFDVAFGAAPLPIA